VGGSEVRIIEIRDVEVGIIVIVCAAGVKGNIVIRTASGRGPERKCISHESAA